MTDFCFLSGILILFIATVFSILALVLDFWEVGNIDSVEIGPIRLNYVHMQAGLWHEYHTLHDFAGTEISTRVGSTTKLWREINFDTEIGMMLFTMRLLLFIAVFSLVAATVCSILRLKVYQEMKSLMNTAWSLSFEAGVLLLVCFVVYLTGIKQNTTDLHAAFYLDILAWLLAWFAAILLFMSSRTFVAIVTEDMDPPAELL
ncbi:uncharacterized protein LOC123534420 [Mercenaria mercenaria]|uniref:uncharacterized protein LOC123534420 n=1 Tax=Mercenaria mercenaria TaxID=6596 RepID=UPI00234F999D|nr:uncharacterized protein LOC123534420 [Mercenaria mercenaria]